MKSEFILMVWAEYYVLKSDPLECEDSETQRIAAARQMLQGY